jgi:hypothetical protein
VVHIKPLDSGWLKQAVGSFRVVLYWRYNSLCLGLLHGFVTVNVSSEVSLATRRTPNPEDSDYTSSCSLPFDLSRMGGSTRSLRSHQHSSPVH